MATTTKPPAVMKSSSMASLATLSSKDDSSQHDPSEVISSAKSSATQQTKEAATLTAATPRWSRPWRSMYWTWRSPLRKLSGGVQVDKGRDLELGVLSSQDTTLAPVHTHASSHDVVPHHDGHWEEGDEIYARFTPKRKILILITLSFCSFLAPISSTSILSAAPEVVETFKTTATIFNLSNAMYMIFMALSAFLYGPLGQTYGRKWPLTFAAATFTAFSIGSAVAPDFRTYFAMRLLTAFQGTAFLTLGQAVLGDIYAPVARAKMVSIFLMGVLVGPAIGPCIAGVIVTYSHWRAIFWLQSALAGVATIAMLAIVPETAHNMRKDDLEGLGRKEKTVQVLKWMNPITILKLFRHPHLCFVAIACGSLVFNMYSLLTPIRYVLNPRFGLKSPLDAGLFYLAPGFGYFFGTFFGGTYSSHVLKKWIAKRDGKRVPEDRLRASLIAMGVVIPSCMLLYGWAIEKQVGGIPLPVIVMFIQGVAQTICFPTLNTYCTEAMPERSSEVVNGNYFLRYCFAGLGSAFCLPAINKIGVGWFSTLSAGFLVAAALGVWATALWGAGWREGAADAKAEESETSE
ncbi:hypothetical protein B0A48_14177 [Cryoendolithus antarcticus]|uniref:Major facilitator superfamily (MFS) profile domain-containing protein n=1 Tax=Cryoendolithus antarcticus TaxID=1507870 RepID=A0A1V8SLF9_9PEZI|nr:hypothetical protein B0A48_14177 [Cryoendolithus antarcticus]